ncbi:MAG: roadblock/LC7 domain-containing protein [Candidatus Thorarchaeota archaeon]|nr:roadblock/LC7 domain-containing protein [Candidatus Thorarchaeota archaeon]
MRDEVAMKRPDYAALAGILEDMNQEGGYTASILARDDGLLMASAANPTTNREVVAAMSGYIAATAERMRKELGLGELRDISVRCSAGKAVFRKISPAGSQPLILAAIMPNNVRYHSRALGKAATKIRRLLK